MIFMKFSGSFSENFYKFKDGFLMKRSDRKCNEEIGKILLPLDDKNGTYYSRYDINWGN